MWFRLPFFRAGDRVTAVSAGGPTSLPAPVLSVLDGAGEVSITAWGAASAPTPFTCNLSATLPPHDGTVASVNLATNLVSLTSAGVATSVSPTTAALVAARGRGNWGLSFSALLPGAATIHFCGADLWVWSPVAAPVGRSGNSQALELTWPDAAGSTSQFGGLPVAIVTLHDHNPNSAIMRLARSEFGDLTQLRSGLSRPGMATITVHDIRTDAASVPTPDDAWVLTLSALMFNEVSAGISTLQEMPLNGAVIIPGAWHEVGRTYRTSPASGASLIPGVNAVLAASELSLHPLSSVPAPISPGTQALLLRSHPILDHGGIDVPSVTASISVAVH